MLLITAGCKKERFSSDSVLFYANAFTPNDDGLNDEWGPEGVGINNDRFSMKIYNKKDKLLYETDNLNNWWSGFVNGELCPVDYYYYVVKYETIDGVKHKDTGMFQLIK